MHLKHKIWLPLYRIKSRLEKGRDTAHHKAHVEPAVNLIAWWSLHARRRQKCGRKPIPLDSLTLRELDEDKPALLTPD